MKNLGKTIDRLIKVAPNLEKKLVQIKNKWEKHPSKTDDCWKELLKYLNSGNLMNHPKRDEMKDILNSKKKRTQEVYSFESVHSNDIIIGIIPENIADIVRRHDRRSIRTAKLRVEASLTKNEKLMAQVFRKEMLLEISTKNLWIKIKDHFDLWTKPVTHSIKSKNNLLVLVEQGHPPPQILGQGVVKMDSTTFKNFLRFLGIDHISPEQLPPEIMDE